ncbi:MAG TPA: lmo0937 family membrane protein [Bacteroidales bacterium]|nr:lmo0937 family membrane protein [Bacteroidales bacterium]
MNRVFLIIGIIFVISWILGFFAFNITSEYIHFFIVVGIILILFDIFRKPVKK